MYFDLQQQQFQKQEQLHQDLSKFYKHLIVFVDHLPPHHAAIASAYESAVAYEIAEDKMMAEIDARENFIMRMKKRGKKRQDKKY